MQNIYDFSFLAERLRFQPGETVLINGTEKNARLFTAVYALREYAKTVFFVCRNDFEARNTYDEIVKYADKDSVLCYPSEPFYFSFPDSWSTEVSVKRLQVCERLLSGEPSIIILSAWSLCEVFPAFGNNDVREYRTGDTLEPDELVHLLASSGYTRDDKVFSRGQYAVRGGIVDFYSACDEYPVRVEFFGDEIDSVRRFSPETMLTRENDDSFRVTPFTQYMLEDGQLDAAYERFISAGKDSMKDLKDPDLLRIASEENGILTEKVSRDLRDAARLLYPFSDTALSGILDLAEDALVLFSDLTVLKNGVTDQLRMITDDYTVLAEKACAFPQQLSVFRDIDRVRREADRRFTTVYFAAVRTKAYDFTDKEVYLGGADVINYRGNLRLFLPSLDMYRKNGYKVIISCTDAEQEERAKRLFESYSLRYVSEPVKGEAAIVVMSACPGIDFASDKVVIVPFEFLMPSSTVRKKSSGDIRSEFFSDIKPGDYVVHDTHGIGIYEGITRIDIDGVSRDYIKIAYAQQDCLFVPPEQMDLIQKYVGAGEAAPKINRLGSSDWASTKKRVSKAVKELAEEYIKMYAARQKIKGYAFGDDTVYQTEFEDAFEFIPTEDQIRCSEEIKEDMSKPVPMDRLLMGDVGFGKTEVAMRAAFKAVMEPKQVAVLVPTTILALQHYNNFTERFKGYPVNIELMCRFRTPSQMKETVQNVKSGKTDILIGTHRILSKDVEFKDLGLLIIDEEQRFGVAHKDRLKLLKTNVDTLTLSATPIPRTMNMSLSGIRDMSVMNTPPSDRLEVQTFVMPSDDAVIKSAVMNELSRNGQVFYLYNRVETIAERAFKIKTLVPDARVEYAHGQMSERELEKKILDFLDHKFDVLVCTTIIENGVDIVNANTIIIEDADKLGLSQLYQLRGRVGRGNIRAYAYMLYNQHKELNDTASKRLETIKEFTRFGSGFRIAMRDLQIRGAGNILGANQHGHFANVGYEMYCRMLGEAVSESLGEEVANVRKVCEIDMRVNAFIPKEYITSEEDRILAYKNIALIRTEDDLSRVTDELTDIYSDMPAVTLNLLKVALLKSQASECGITRIRQNADTVICTFDKGVRYDPLLLSELGKKFPFRVRSMPDSTQLIISGGKGKDIFVLTCDLIKNLVGKRL